MSDTSVLTTECKTLAFCLLCNPYLILIYKQGKFKLKICKVRLRHALSGVPWPFTQKTQGVISTVFLSRNPSCKQRSENVTLQPSSGLRAELSWVSAGQAVVPLGCSPLCLAAKSTGAEISPEWDQPGLAEQLGSSGSRVQVSQPQKILLNSQQNTVCSAK